MTASYKNGSITLPNATRNGYTFEGWYTSATGGELVGKSGATYTPTSTKTLYAQWKKTITITYNANGGSNAPSSQTATVYNSTTSYTFTLRTTKPTREGYVFAGWATSATSTTINWQPGDTVKFDSSQTLYAVWAVAQMRLNGVINYYSSLASAVNAATDNTEMTITMLVNRTEEPLEIPSNKSINLDLNNTTLECSITNRGTLKVSSGNINISSSYSNNFAIRNLGTAEITNGIYTVTGGNTLINEIGGTLNIKNGNFVNDGSGTNIYNNAVLNVYGGTFTSNQYGIVTASELSYDDIAISNISNVTINVKGTAIQSGNTNGNEIMARGISYVYNSILKGDESASYVVGDDKGSVIVLYDCTTQGAYKYNVTEVKTDSKGYDVYVYNVPSSYTIICPTWTTANGQDDMTWENATNMGNGTHHYRVDISRHNDGERGEYITTIYRWTNGAIVDGWQFTVNIP